MFGGRGRRGLRAAGADDSLGLFPRVQTGDILSLFYVAMPVGGAWATPWAASSRNGSGPRKLALGLLCRCSPRIDFGNPSLVMRESPTGAADAVSTHKRMTWRDYRILLQTPSFVLDTAGNDGDVVRHGGLGLLDARLLGGPSRRRSVWASSGGPYSASSRPWPGWAARWSAACWATGCGRGCRARISWFPARDCCSVRLRAVVLGRALSLGMVHDLRRRFLHVRQHRTDECDPGQCGPSGDASCRIRREHPGDSRAGRRDFAADYRHGVGRSGAVRPALPWSRYFWPAAACSGSGAGDISSTIPRWPRKGCRSPWPTRKSTIWSHPTVSVNLRLTR